jgi:hypothetical protein
MKVYTFVIGSMDDFEGVEDLMDYAEQEGFAGSLNYSIFEFDCPADCSEEIITMMGRGYAFSSDWCMDGTYSFLVEGPLETKSEKDMFKAGEAAREAEVERARGRTAQQGIDVWCANDPVNW